MHNALLHMASKQSESGTVMTTIIGSDSNSTTDMRVVSPPTDRNRLIIIGVAHYFHHAEDERSGPMSGVQTATDWLRKNTDIAEPKKKIESYCGQSCSVIRRPSGEQPGFDRPTVGVNVPETVLEDPDPTGVTEAGQLIHQLADANDLSITDGGLIDPTPIIERHSTNTVGNARLFARRALCRYTWINVPDGYEFDGDDHSSMFCTLFSLYAGNQRDVLDRIDQLVNNPPRIPLFPTTMPDRDIEAERDEIVVSHSPLQLEGMNYDVRSLSPTNVQRDGPYAVFFYLAGINYALREIQNELETLNTPDTTHE